MKRELSTTAANMGSEEWNALVSKKQNLIECRKSLLSQSSTEEDDPMDDAVQVFEKWMDAGEQVNIGIALIG